MELVRLNTSASMTIGRNEMLNLSSPTKRSTIQITGN